jgi:sulfopyruvate decarboxylase subunit beta
VTGLARIDPSAALAVLRRVRRPDDVVITTMATARDWMAAGTDALDIVFVPSAMGHATSLGIGLALAQPQRRIVVCNGDGSLLMNLGSLVTIAAAGVENLTVILFDNGVYEVTGAQPTPRGPAGVDFAAIARGSGIRSTRRYSTNQTWESGVDAVFADPGPRFVALDVAPVVGKPGPRSPGKAGQRAADFMRALGIQTR